MRFIFLLLTLATLSLPSPAEAAFENYTALFAQESSGLPENVRVLGVRVDEGCLTLNLSAEVLQYGGNQYEKELIGILLDTAESVQGVTYFTLLIDGQTMPLTEGREINRLPIFG